MRRGCVALLAALSACGGSLAAPLDAPDAGDDGGTEEAGVSVPPECLDAGVPSPTLECAGLYSDVASKQLAPGVRVYAPAVPLWADGSGKNRWIVLPQGTTIDATDPNEWVFPVGTKLFKEFSRDGIRVETRLFQKVKANTWVRATYRWNGDESAATISGGVDIPWGDGGTYHIPSGDECDECHRGRNEHIMGFEQVSLGLEGATGLTLSELVAENLITPPPARTKLTIGDDGTGAAAAPLAWLHINCGTTCHNANENSYAYGAGMRLRLDATQLDGRSVVDFDSLRTTLGQMATTPTWNGQTRIVPGDADDSLLCKLISHRGQGQQMPPIASSIVDVPDSTLVQQWIDRMPAPPSDAGPDAAEDGGDDAAYDSGPEGGADATSDEGGADATLEDSGDTGDGGAKAPSPGDDAAADAADAGASSSEAGVGSARDAGSADASGAAD
jgi:hypothetical protein